MSTALQPWSAYDGQDTRFNVLRPMESMLTQNPLVQVYANVVSFTEADTYPVDGGKRALNGTALAKIAAAAGISFLAVQRHDDGRDPSVAEVSVHAVMRRPDGSWIHATGKKRVDVAAYAAQELSSKLKKNENAKPGEKKSEEQIRRDVETNRLQLAKFRAERAETGAKNRAIRQLLAMKASYSPAELQKPFVVPQITVNMSAVLQDEYGRRVAIDQALSGIAALFGGGTLPNMTTPGMASPAALPAGATVESDPVAPPASAEPPAPTREEILTAEWTNARPGERVAKLNALLAEREHGLSDKAVDELFGKDAAYQAKMIAWLTAKPMKATNGTPTNGTPAIGTPTNGTAHDETVHTGAVNTGSWAPSEKQIKRLYGIAKKFGYDTEALHAFIAERFGGITSVNDLTRDQYDTLTGHEANPEYNQEELIGLLEQRPYNAPVPTVNAAAADSKLDDLPF